MDKAKTTAKPSPSSASQPAVAIEDFFTSINRLEYIPGWGIGLQTLYLNGFLFHKRIEPHIAKNPLTGFSTGDRDFRLEALNLSSEPHRRGLNQDNGPVAPARKKPDSFTASHITIRNLEEKAVTSRAEVKPLDLDPLIAAQIMVRSKRSALFQYNGYSGRATIS
ncbi:hypothetical protein F0562_022647 [Nyssa sinensis]|uniref:Uncharacterized protein n=1 Tax=Nyssa sinensis TaxID=561372 RepID=A0A5J5BNK5_9ASTE|nr:hypothetical protein F0562_022647 [Nyssa sinensis]